MLCGSKGTNQETKNQEKNKVMSILKSQPDVKEVCVKKVYPLRFAAEGRQEKYEQFYQQFNDAMHK